MDAVKNPAKPSARERLLASADELFYREGVHTVGIDRVIEHAGVAKASLYNTFGSKEALIRAYLELRRTRVADRILRHIEGLEGPRAKLLGVFDAQSLVYATPNYRGCAFVAASAEAHLGDQVVEASDAARAWVRTLFTELAEQAGVAYAPGLARRMQLLYDGGGVSARMDRDPSAGAVARECAELLLDAALAASARQPEPAARG